MRRPRPLTRRSSRNTFALLVGPIAALAAGLLAGPLLAAPRDSGSDPAPVPGIGPARQVLFPGRPGLGALPGLEDPALEGAPTGGSLPLQSFGPPAIGSPLDGEWNQLPSGGQVFHGAVYDSLRDRLIVIGGWRGGVPSVSVRAYDLSGGGGWLDLTPAVPGPQGLTSSGVVYDSARDRIVIFGGGNATGAVNNEIWALNLQGTRVWTQIVPNGGSLPPARDECAAIYDPVGDRLIIFGGIDAGNSTLGDVWAFSLGGPGTWTNLVPNGTSGPGHRQAPAAVYDSRSHLMIVHGGWSGDTSSYMQDTWALLLDAGPFWLQLPSSSVPRIWHTATYDPDADAMVIFGGFDGSGYLSSSEVLSLSDPQAWSQPIPDFTGRPTLSQAAAFDSRRHRHLVHGGINTSSMYEDVIGLGNPAAGWFQVTNEPRQPRWRFVTSSVLDAARNEVVVFGGSMGGGEVGNSVWALGLQSPERWVDRTPTSGPSPVGRMGHVAVVDPGHDRMIVIGGGSTASFAASAPRLSDVWSLALGPSGGGWTQLSIPPGGPGARQFAAAVYDPVGDRLVLMGGVNASGVAQNDVWTLNCSGSPAWTRIFPAGAPPVTRARHAMVYDSVRQRILIFGGLNGATRLNDVWELSLGATPTWTNLAPAGTAPTARYWPGAIYDALGDRLVIFGGNFNLPPFNDAWALPLSQLPLTWAQLAPTGNLPEARYGHTVVYDPREGRMVMYGGLNGSNFLRGDTWTLQWPRPLQGEDLTTTGASSIGRYVVNLGQQGGQTRDQAVAGPAGVHDISSAPGNGDPWFGLNDGAPSFVNTFGGTSPDWFGWRFKAPMTVRGLRFDNDVLVAEGKFQTTPNVQVYDGSTWQTVAANWSPPYDTSPGTGVRSYAITLVSPAVGARGVRLIGDAGGVGDGDGFIAISELSAVGTPTFSQPIDFAVDLTGEVGVEPTVNGKFSAGFPEAMIDDDLETVGVAGDASGSTSVGVHWTTPQDSVAALGVVFQFNAGTGWFDESVHPLVVEWTGDHGQTWQPVQNLSRSSYPSDVAALAALPYAVKAGFLFTFDPVDGVDGLRIRGDVAGGPSGLVTVAELEAFATSAAVLPAPGPPLSLVMLSGVSPGGYATGPTPTLTWKATAPAIDQSLVQYRTFLDLTSPFLATVGDIGRTWANPVSIGPEIGPAAPAALFQVQRFNVRGPAGPPIHYRFPVANGSYDVRLFFAEMEPGVQIGQRVFDVALEGVPVLVNFDMLAQAAANTALVRSFPVNVSDGELDVEVTTVDRNAMIAGIEVLSQSPVRPIYRVDAGGPALAAADGSYPGWSADLDAAPTSDFGPSESGTYPGLVEGLHHLRVDARAFGALRDTVLQLFQVDHTPPSFVFVAPTPPEGAWIASDSVLFGVAGSDNASLPSELSVLTSLDGVLQPGTFPAGTFPVRGLTEGERQVGVAVRDLAGNGTPQAIRTLRVDRTAPDTYITAPAAGDTIPVSSVTLTVGGTDALSPSLRFTHALNGNVWSAPSAETTTVISGIPDGAATFDAAAIDLAGNTDATPAHVAFVVDANPPDVAFTLAPDPGACIATRAPSLSWTASDIVTPHAALRFETRLDAGSFIPVGPDTHAVLGPLARGQHTFLVRATDLVGHARTISRTFVVDPSPPVVFAPTARLLDAALVSFQCSGNDSVGVTGFHLQVSDAPDFSTLLADPLLGAAGKYDFAGVPGQSYYYRASASDCAGNTSAFSSPIGAIAIPSLPDLVVENVQASANSVVSGQSMGVHWVVRNAALGGTSNPNWRDRLYLSQDGALDLDGRDILLAEYVNVTHLAPGEAYARDQVLTLPRGIAGTYHVIVSTDFYDELPESLGTDNALASDDVNVTLADAADLQALSVQTLPFDEWIAGSTMQVAWTVKNAGRVPADTDRWFDTVFLSDQPTLHVDAIGGDRYQFHDRPLAAVQFVGLLDSSQSYSKQAGIRLPLDLQDRDYYVFVVADQQVSIQNQIVPQAGEVFENGADLNVSPAYRIHAIPRPPANLTVTSVGAPASSVSGLSIPVSWTVFNGGDTTLVNVWVDRVYLSMNDSLDAGDVLLASQTRSGALAQLGSYDVTLPVTLPAFIEGTYRLLVQTDATGLLPEANELDNVGIASSALAIQMGDAPDLVVRDGSQPGQGVAASSIGVRWHVDNAGAGAANGSWSDFVYLTSTPAWNPAGAILLSTRGNPGPLVSSGGYDQDVVIALPASLAPGAYTMWIVTDAANQVAEHLSEGNNVTSLGALAVLPYPAVDLAVAPVAGPTSAGSGTTVPVTWSVANGGQGPTIATSWRDRVYLSTDDVLDGGDVALATTLHGGALAPGGSYQESASITLPNGQSGSYRLLVQTDIDHGTGDGLLANNVVAFPDPLVVSLTPPPNLAVEDVVPGASPVAGQPYSVQWTELNVDDGPTIPGNWSTYVYLSIDPVYGNGDDQLVASLDSPASLAGHTSRPAAVSFEIPRQASGPYFLLVRTDATRSVYESNEDDNVAASPPINVALAPPADLVVTSAALPVTVVPGQPVSVSWTVENQGPNGASGLMRDVVYLSDDAVFDATHDPVLGLVTRSIDLAPGQHATYGTEVQVDRTYELSDDGQLTAVVPALTPGPHYAFVRTNVLRNIRETDYDNNLVAPPPGFDVEIPDLPIGGSRSATLAPGEAAFWRIDVPAAGKDLLVSVESGQPGATNELFASFGTTPDPRSFEFSGPPEFTPSPFIAIPSTRAGTYFVRLSNNTLPSGIGSATMTISARVLPYSVTSITPNHGGGQVTCAVRGAGFTGQTRFLLGGGNGAPIEGAVVSRDNSGLAYVTFDVGLSEPGPYDFTAATGESTATVPGGFTVEPASALTLETSIEGPDVIRQNSTALETVRYLNTSNRNIPFLRTRVLLSPEVEITGLTALGGLLKRSDLWPQAFASPGDDARMIRNPNGPDSLRAIDLVARNVPPGQELKLFLSLRGFGRDIHSVRALVRLDGTDAFLADAIDGIERARQDVLAGGQPIDPALEPLVGDPFAMRDSALAHTYMASGLVGAKTITQYLRALPPGDLGAGSGSQGPTPPELDPGNGPCVRPGVDPGCALSEPQGSDLPACRSCFGGDFAGTLFLPQRLDVTLAGSSCSGYQASVVRDVEVVSPCDPNLIASTTTPAAFGNGLGERWMSKNAVAEYTVYFENTRETATAAAKSVRISVPIPANMAPSSFRIRSYWIGAGTAGAGGYTRTIDPPAISHTDDFLFNNVQVFVQMTQSGDSLLFLFSTPSEAGFLPVNDATQQGQGGVVFDLSPRSDAPSGARIAELARVQFDAKPPLATNTDSLRLDAVPPTSLVNQAQQLDSTNVRVRWSGQDDPQGTGVKAYDLWVQRDAQPFQLLRGGLTGNEVTLPLTRGSQYGFYTRAQDNTTNLEAAPASAQATITLPGLVDAPAGGVPLAFALHQNAPNPFRGQSVIRFELPQEAEPVLEIYTVAGRRVTTLLGGKRFPAGQYQAVVDGRTIPPGVYFYQLRAGGHVASRKLILLGR